MTISFAWTTDALIAGKKTVTRRDWPDSHARKFVPGKIVTAYNKQACFGGHPIARLEIVSVRREPLSALLDNRAYAKRELEREGALWRSLDDFLALFKGAKHGDPYRIEFRVLEIISS